MKPDAPGLLSTITACFVILRDLLAERARELVGGAAGRERHDERELLVGILGAAPHPRGEREQREENGGEDQGASVDSSMSYPSASPCASFGSRPLPIIWFSACRNTRTPSSASMNRSLTALSIASDSAK